MVDQRIIGVGMEKDKKIADSSELRRVAEKNLKETAGNIEEISGMSPEKMASLIHELQAHQIELEMKNEELLRIQVELEKTRDEYALLYDFAPVGYFKMSEKGIIDEVNFTGADMIGMERSDLIGKPFTRFVLKKDQDIFNTHRQCLLETETTHSCELWLVKKDGHLFHAHMECLVIKNKRGDLIQIWSAVSDITEHKRTEEALKKSEQRYRNLVESTADWVWASDPEGRQTFANEAAKDILGYELHEIIGASADSFIHPEDAKRVQKWLKKAVEEKKGWKNAVIRWEHKDGSIKFLESTARPVLNSEGDLVGFVGIDRDVTERLWLEQQLSQAQKMEAIGTLAGGVAHDFNNFLSIVIGNVDLMLMELKEGHPFHGEIMEIRNAATGAASLTRQLLAFSRKQVIHPEIIHLNDVIDTASKMLERLISENIDFQTFLDPDLEPVKVDSGQMEQVIINLSVNARDAMATGGQLTIETKNLYLNEDFFQSQGVKGEVGPYVMMRVSDTGCGIEEKILPHIFIPFFTTKGMERGTGLGLSSVYGIIKQNNGYIFVQSKPGKGSVFEIYLPAAKEGKKPAAADIIIEDSLAGEETILVVEDDMQLKKLTSRILERYHYRVLQASNGEEALKVSQKHDGPIDLVLTDVIMPGMNIQEVAERIKSRRKETKILYMSGYMDNSISQYGVLESGIDFLQKPYTPEGLFRKIREVLDRNSGD
jgi:two-component system cell cycle sensor histidine kinase/response regulator CckA